MKKLYLQLALIITFFGLTTPTCANNPAQGQLKIEVVVFQTGALRGWTEERWPELYDQKFFNQEELLTQYKLLAPNQLELLPQVSKMTPEKGYTILAHFGWTQPAYNKNQAKFLAFDSSWQANPNHPSSISGGVKTYKERYNHAEIYIDLDRPIPNAIKERFAENQQLEKEYLPITWRFRLDEARRIKAGELHYIDHPIFGILIKVNSI